MSRVDQVLLFWKEQDPTVRSMLLKSNAQELNDLDRPEIISYLPHLKGKKILELAAGIGRFTSHLSAEGSHVTAVDFAAHFIEKNQHDLASRENIDFICADVMDLEFPDSSFDFVFFSGLFMYLEDDEIELLLSQIHRWLKPGGELFFRESCDLTRSKKTNNGYYAIYRSLAEYDNLVKKRFTIVKDGNIKAHVYHFADPFQLFWHCRKIS